MKNEYKISRDLMMSWAKEYYFQGAKNFFIFILLCILGVCALIISICGILLEKWYYCFLGVLYLFFAIFQLFFARLVYWKNQYKTYSRTYGVTEWIRSIEFTNEEIILCDHTAITKLKYENITINKIKEKNNVVMVSFNKNLALRLYKDAFIEGSWEECKDKITSMMK